MKKYLLILIALCACSRQNSTTAQHTFIFKESLQPIHETKTSEVKIRYLQELAINSSCASFEMSCKNISQEPFTLSIDDIAAVLSDSMLVVLDQKRLQKEYARQNRWEAFLDALKHPSTRQTLEFKMAKATKEKQQELITQSYLHTTLLQPGEEVSKVVSIRLPKDVSIDEQISLTVRAGGTPHTFIMQMQACSE